MKMPRRGPPRRAPYKLYLYGRKAPRRDLAILLGLVVGLTLASWTSYHFGYGWGYGSPKAGPEVTLRDLIQGKVASAHDKWGDGGTLVTIRHVVVHKFSHEDDGDWFLGVSDPTYANGDFVVEVIKRDQASVHKPPLHVPLTLIGVPYCDLVHGTEERFGGEEWHTGGSCWEIHPLYSWSQEALVGAAT